MEWVFSTTWIQSASRLDAGDARRLLAFHNKLIEDPEGARTGFNFEHLNHVRDRRVQSLRVERDVRAIVWHDGALCVLLYVDHHAGAYRWAESATVNVTSGAHGVAVAVTTGTPPNVSDTGTAAGEGNAGPCGEPGLFDCLSTPELLAAGCPEVLLPVVRSIRDDAAFDELTPALNAELCDRLVALYLDGGAGDVTHRPEEVPEPTHDDSDAPPDGTQALGLRDLDPDDFQRLIENPTEWWVAFADPLQRKIAEGKFSGAVLVTGGAGTGKTIVALHRARHLARKGKRVLLTSFGTALCAAMERDARLLCADGDLEQIHVANVDRVAREICPDDQGEIPFPGEDAYARRIRLACEVLARKRVKSPYDAVIVDETQDLDPQRLVLLRALAGKGRDSFMLLGDTNQRIYGQPLDLEDLGISVEGRSFVLAATYRTTREIAEFGQSILTDEGRHTNDLPGGHEAPASGVPGPRPTMAEFSSTRDEALWVAMAILENIQHGVPPQRIAVFARRRKRLGGIECALNALSVPCMNLKLGTGAPLVGVRLMTMHQARGLEFRVVFVVSASDDELPNSSALKDAETDERRCDALQRERSLLHVSATRATHVLHVAWVGRPTDFLAGCDEAAESSSGFDVTQFLAVELDTTSLEADPAGFRIGGHDHVVGGRQISLTLRDYLESHEKEWMT